MSPFTPALDAPSGDAAQPAPGSPPHAPSPIAPSSGDALAALRAEIDAVDDALHDLLMRRAGIVERVGRLGAKGRVALRPGREAAIVRRLLARNHPPLPGRAVARVWRELLAATTGMQAPFVVTVCEREAGDGLAELAREHFGALTPLRVRRSPAQAIAEVSAGAASVALLPLPSEDEADGAAWWTALLHRDDPRIHVVARLPFWAPRGEGATRAGGFAVATVPPDPSGRDRSLIGVELAAGTSRARFAAALATARFEAGAMLVRRARDAGETRVLVEVAGFVAEGDERLARLAETARPPVLLGAYAVPIEEE